jgi:hypothetical protein
MGDGRSVKAWRAEGGRWGREEHAGFMGTL